MHTTPMLTLHFCLVRFTAQLANIWVKIIVSAKTCFLVACMCLSFSLFVFLSFPLYVSLQLCVLKINTTFYNIYKKYLQSLYNAQCIIFFSLAYSRCNRGSFAILYTAIVSCEEILVKSFPELILKNFQSTLS
jgi:hypothetical protein